MECVGIHAAKRGTRFEALEPTCLCAARRQVRRGVRECFGAFGKGVAQGLTLRHDHGGQYLSDVFQEEARFLGVTSSPAFVREPEGNGCVERFVRILKEHLLWVRSFATVEELRLALQVFGDAAMTTALLDRLTHKAQIINCPWESYRLKQSLKEKGNGAKTHENNRAQSIERPTGNDRHRGHLK